MPGSAPPDSALGEPKEGWHLDKKVPIALIAAILIQTAGALVWAGAASQRLDMLEASVAALKDTNRKLSVVETHIGYMREAIDDIKENVGAD